MELIPETTKHLLHGVLRGLSRKQNFKIMLKYTSVFVNKQLMSVFFVNVVINNLVIFTFIIICFIS